MPRMRMGSAEWIPGRDPGWMVGVSDDCKVTIHTEGVDRGRHGRQGDAINLARYVQQKNIGYHFVYDYRGQFAQLYTPKQGARALLAGPWSPNRQGKVNIQICFAGVADAADVRHWPLENWEKFLRFVEAWGVPPRAICNFDDPKRDVSDWKRSGWTCHAAAPFNDHTDGRGAPIRKLLAR